MALEKRLASVDHCRGNAVHSPTLVPAPFGGWYSSCGVCHRRLSPIEDIGYGSTGRFVGDNEDGYSDPDHLDPNG